MKNFYERNKGNSQIIINCFIEIIKGFDLNLSDVKYFVDKAFKLNLELIDTFDGAGQCDNCSFTKCGNRQDYDHFIAECYEAEDEFWKGIYEEIEADYWINENKNNF